MPPAVAATRAQDPAARMIARVEALRRAQPAQAIAALERGMRTALAGATPAQRGELWRLRGHVLRSLQRAREAVVAYRRAEREYARAGDGRERGRVAIGLVDALMYLGRTREALQAATRGRRLLERAGDAAALARLLNNEGNLHHRLDLPDRALLCYRAARRTLARSGDARGAAMVDGNVANCLSLLGRLAEARTLYTRAKQRHARAGFELDALTADYNLAYLDFLEHRHERALAGLAAVRDEARRRGSPSVVALAGLDRAEIFLRVGSHDEALAEARQAIADCRALGLAYESAKAETFAALAEFRLGRAGLARARLERTLAAFHDAGNQVWAGEALVGLATIWWHARDPRGAAALLAASARQFAAAGDREREGCARALLARAALESGDRALARACLAWLTRRAPRHATPRLRHLALAAEAALARAQGDTARARRALTRAARTSERLAARILDEHWRATFWGEWGWPHQELAALEIAAGRIGPALEALEAGRGRALVGVAHARRGRGAALPERVRAWAAAQLAGERQRGAGEVITGGDGASAKRMRDGAAHAVAPAVRRALDERPQPPLRAAALQRELPEGTLLVDYLVLDGELHAIAVRREGLVGHARLASVAQLARLAHGMLFTLRGAAFRPVAERGADPGLEELLASLAACALWPLLGRGADALPRALLVMPVGPLVRVPWAALPLPDGRRLCETMEVTVAPGLRLARSRDARVPTGRPLVVAADTGELASVAPETRAVLAAFPDARVLAGAEASADRVLALAPDAPWIHFAGHGHFRADAPHESGLRLADRWLVAGEIEGLALGARWITLSACSTARALVLPGEEWFGLARTLLVAGARNVVAAQWDVGDEAAARLMTALYARLGAGEPLHAALAAAQAERLHAGDHPLDWAGFVALGGTGSLMNSLPATRLRSKRPGNGAGGSSARGSRPAGAVHGSTPKQNPPASDMDFGVGFNPTGGNS